MADAARKRLSYSDYLRLEHQTTLRHEFLNGEAWAMAGGTMRHSAIKSNLMVLLGSALRGRLCRAYDSDLKVCVLATGLATYPDLSVICGPPESHPDDANAATNPTLIVEVLSKDTEAWDRGGKFLHYGQMSSLQHYLLVAQNEQRVEHFERQADGAWRLSYHRTGSVPLAALGIELPVGAIYEDLPESV